MSASEEVRTQRPWLLILAMAAALLALVIDLLDGHASKSVGTAGLFVGLVGLLAVRSTGRASYNYLAIAGFVLFIASVVYRMCVHQGWIQG
ncbi:MAG: hypothetical protein IPG10_01035 [Flavobacteriales bacterium]|jgi:hypothetical protein|nr:hypothetical protein [Flavobacteriales bacterium]MBK6753221.1 hypothetical protein [Flavobacteriales bacterium]MBK7085046.1 hypothetical protein [Flavobacteriales bacterium]MBK7269747.1 hypothetical protein [Flavobacteriales bacterium]MBK7752591.1 hypothetical protein [Flavobacteriales bacterium]